MAAMKRLLAAALAIGCCLVLAPGALARAHLGSPGGVALSADGRTLYYSDLDRSRVVAFTPAGRVRALIGQGVLRYQSGIAVAPGGTLYVADKHTGRVRVFSPAGAQVAAWGHFGFVASIAIDAAGDLYVTDSTRGVARYTPSGERLATWNRRGSRPGEFSVPNGVAVAPSGDVYVADTANHRVQALDPTGRVVAVWGHRGTGRGALEYPMGIAVGRDGLVYVADESSVQVFDPRGRFVRRVHLVDDAAPAEVAVAADGTLYVASSPSTMTGEVAVYARSGRFLRRL